MALCAGLERGLHRLEVLASMFGMARDAGNAGVTMRGNNAGGEALGLMAGDAVAFIFSRFAMLTPIAWQEVHEPPSVFWQSPALARKYFWCAPWKAAGE